MRVPGTALELRIGREFATASNAPVQTQRGNTPRGATGVDGDSPFADLTLGGIDINPELTGLRKYLIYEEMRKSDPSVKSALFMYKLPIRQADWALDAFSTDGIDQLIHDAVAWQFGLEEQDGQLDLTWDEWLQQTMLFFDFGAMGEEVVEGDLQIWRPSGDDGTNTRLIKPIARFAPRFAGTFLQIEDDPRTGRIVRAKQMMPNADWIPGDQLVWYAPEKEGRNWHGVSMLRAMYGPWRLKKALMIAAAIGWDRFSVGVPVVRYPMGGGSKAKAEAENIARNIRVHERAWVALEGNDAQGWKLDIVGGTGNMGDPVPLIRLYDEQIAAAALQQFSKLGTTPTGARAVGEILVDPFYQAVSAYANYVAGIRQREAIRRFVTMNFGEQYECPKIRVGKIQSKNVLVLAQAIEFLSAAGLSFTDRETQNDVRDMLDLKHLPETVQEALDENPEVGVEQTTPPVEGQGLPVAA